MQAHPGFRKLTESEIEIVKKDGSFDRVIVDWLIPPTDPVRRYPSVNKKLEELVAREVNPWVIRHLQKGGDSPPGAVFDSAKKENERPKADPISRELADFLTAASRASSGPILERKDAQGYSRQLKRLLEEITWRKGLKQRARTIAVETKKTEENGGQDNR